MISALASEVHYLETLAPIWVALDPGLRTEFMVPDHLWDHARTLGVEPSGIRLGTSGIGLVASGRDMAAWDGPTILAEHGAGQSYQGDPASADHPAYAGGEGRENVILFLVPGPDPAARNRNRYPHTPVVEIGCPRLDRLRSIAPQPHPPTIVVAFHWGAGVCPESGTAFYHWRDHLEPLTETYRVLGTGHPRAFQELAGWYEAHGIIPVENFELVVAEADLLVADNTSVIYEWAALDRPVVCLNDPSWRKDVRHGLRFYDAIPGPMVDDPVDLAQAIERADSRGARRMRDRAARLAYAWPDHAGRRAARAIERTLAQIGAIP